MDNQIKEMKEQGIIAESRSPWNSPLFLVPKRDGSFRPVIDFTNVNEMTVSEQFPLPVLSDLLMNLGEGNKFFSSLDLLTGYWQVPMAPESRQITAFSTPNGRFEWLRMPFGLKTTLITFQRMIQTLLGDLKDQNVFAYLDDAFIASPDVDSHLASLESVFSRLQSAGLKLKLSKCEFLRNRIRFLCHEINENGIHTQADKIEAVSKFPVPKTVDHPRSFLGLAGYYRPYVRHFSAIASPLNHLIKNGVIFHWDTPQHVVADALSRNVGAVTADSFPVENFSLLDLRAAQREHDVWKAVIYALESCDETALPSLAVPFSQFSLPRTGY